MKPENRDNKVTELAPDTAAVDADAPKGSVRSSRKRYGSSLEFVRAKAAEALAKVRAEEENVVLQQELALWSDELRGVPNPMIRSGLFGIKTTGKREHFENQVVVSLSNFKMLYTGKELLQDDLSVWMSLLNLASRQRIGDTVFFTGYQLIKDIGWSVNKVSYVRARQCLERLKANAIKIQLPNGQRGYSGALIRDFAWVSKEDGTENASWWVRFEPKIVDLFQPDTVTFVQWSQRKQIGSRATLTLWLHSFYTSHRDPLPISLAKIHELARSEQKDMRFFRRRVQNALETLKKIGLLTSYAISDGDIVTVKKAPVHVASLKNAATQRLLG